MIKRYKEQNNDQSLPLVNKQFVSLLLKIEEYKRMSTIPNTYSDNQYFAANKRIGQGQVNTGISGNIVVNERLTNVANVVPKDATNYSVYSKTYQPYNAAVDGKNTITSYETKVTYTQPTVKQDIREVRQVRDGGNVRVGVNQAGFASAAGAATSPRQNYRINTGTRTNEANYASGGQQQAVTAGLRQDGFTPRRDNAGVVGQTVTYQNRSGYANRQALQSAQRPQYQRIYTNQREGQGARVKPAGVPYDDDKGGCCNPVLLALLGLLGLAGIVLGTLFGLGIIGGKGTVFDSQAVGTDVVVNGTSYSPNSIVIQSTVLDTSNQTTPNTNTTGSNTTVTNTSGTNNTIPTTVVSNTSNQWVSNSNGSDLNLDGLTSQIVTFATSSSSNVTGLLNNNTTPISTSSNITQSNTSTSTPSNTSTSTPSNTSTSNTTSNNNITNSTTNWGPYNITTPPIFEGAGETVNFVNSNTSASTGTNTIGVPVTSPQSSTSTSTAVSNTTGVQASNQTNTTSVVTTITIVQTLGNGTNTSSTNATSGATNSVSSISVAPISVPPTVVSPIAVSPNNVTTTTTNVTTVQPIVVNPIPVNATTTTTITTTTK